jgi:hypothetical protein
VVSAAVRACWTKDTGVLAFAQLADPLAVMSLSARVPLLRHACTALGALEWFATAMMAPPDTAVGTLSMSAHLRLRDKRGGMFDEMVTVFPSFPATLSQLLGPSGFPPDPRTGLQREVGDDLAVAMPDSPIRSSAVSRQQVLGRGVVL